MSARRVLYHYSSTQADTGSPRALLRMIDSLPADRYRPLYLTSRTGPLIAELCSRDVELVPGEVDSVSWRAPLALATAVKAKVALLRRHRIDLVHLNEIGWNSDVVLAARVAGIPAVLHVHNPMDIEHRNLNFRLASRILLCSHYQGAVAPHFERIAAKCVVLHNSVDIERYAAGRSIRETFGFPADATIVATIGQISHRKGVDVFLDMAARLRGNGRPLRYVIVGPPARDEDAYVQEIEQRLRSEFADDVRYLGSRRDIPDLLASIDLFCFPTRAEPFGMVIVEAMAAGVPVVVSRVGGVPEILTDPALGTMVDPPTPDAFARAVGELVARGPDLKAMGERGRASLAGRFDTPSMTTRLAAIYDGLFT